MHKNETKHYKFDLTSLINQVPGGIAIYKLSNPVEILYFNDGVCALSGHTREEYQEIVKNDAMSIVFDGDKTLLMEEVGMALSENRKIDFTYRIYHKNKGLVWVHLSAMNMREENGQFIYYAMFMDISDERNMHKSLRELASRDGLTGALNRISFENKIEGYLLKNEMDIAAFLMLDIDNFKQVNDYLGHIKGDEALCLIAKLLRSVFGTESFVARMGGDEFAVFVTNITSKEELAALVETFCQQSQIEYKYQDSIINISCSVGIAMIPKDGLQYATLYTNADQALLYAKNNGKNQHRFFGEFMSPPSSLLLQNMEWLLDEGVTAIHICNSETYELLYMNRLCREMAKIQGKFYLGKTCYEELMHRDSPCPFCKMSDMKKDSFCECEYVIPNTDTKLVLKGKLINWNGIKAYVEFISQQKAAN